MAELVGLYGHLVGARIRSQLQYRLSFALYAFGQFLASFADLLAILVIFNRVPALRGWSVDEVLFLYGTSQLAFTLADLFVSPVDRCAAYVKEGTFDQLLCRPLGSLFQLCTLEFELRRAGKVIQASLLLAIAVTRLPVPWTPARVGVTVAMIVCGFVLFGSIWVITSSIAFWTVESSEVHNSFTYGGGYLSQYPVDIFASWLRRVLLLVPLAFVSYLPAVWVLGRDGVYENPGLRLASPLVAVIASLVAAAVWRAAVRHYRSTGS